MDTVPLSEMLAELRKQLRAAQEEAEVTGDIWFFVRDIDLELQVVVSKEVDGKVKLKIPGFTAGGGGEIEKEVIQKVRVKLSPKGADKKSRVYAADENEKF